MPDDEIRGPYTELANLVRAITGNVSRQTAATRSGISHDTVARLWQGFRPYRTTLIQFATGYGVDPNPLLRAAGFPVVLQEQETTPTDTLHQRAGRVVRIQTQYGDTAEITVNGAEYDKLTPEQLESLRLSVESSLDLWRRINGIRKAEVE